MRDLLGITRALYRAELATDLPLAEMRCEKLVKIGQEYQRALKLATTGREAASSRAAWGWAEKVTSALEAFVAQSADVGLMVTDRRESEPSPKAARWLQITVTWNPYPRLPRGAVRDLLGITRALYRSASLEEPRDPDRLRAIADIGKTLHAVLRAGHLHPGTSDYFNAWEAAERATRALGALVGEAQPLAPLIASTARRFTRPGTMG